ncbi:hypothetical protein ACWEOE_30900 [Amycolatopsis sp. NPDC004368]
MAGTGPGEDRDELDSVAKLVSLSETAPMPRIDGERPPLVTRPKPDSEAAAADPSGLYPAPATASLTAAPHTAGPLTQPQSIVGELPVGLDAMFAAAGPEAAAERTQTAPPVSNRRNTRYVVLAGAVVVALAGLGTWALWPAPESGSADQPVQVPVAPSKPSSAPPAVTTMTVSPTPPTATGQVDHTTVRTTEEQKSSQRQQPGGDHGSVPPPQRQSSESAPNVWDSAVSSYLEAWSSRHEQPPTRHR